MIQLHVRQGTQNTITLPINTPSPAGRVAFIGGTFFKKNMANPKTRPSRLIKKGPPPSKTPTAKSGYVQKLENALRDSIDQIEWAARNEPEVVSERSFDLLSQWKKLLRSK